MTHATRCAKHTSRRVSSFQTLQVSHHAERNFVQVTVELQGQADYPFVAEQSQVERIVYTTWSRGVMYTEVF